MGIWARIRDIVGSRTHRAPSGEDLQAAMDEAYRAQLARLQTVRRGVADVSTSRKRVEVRLTRMRDQAEALDAEARSAVANGDDAAARSALARKVTLEQALTDLEERHAMLRGEEEKITRTAQQLETSIEEFRLRKDTLSARHSAAAARSEVLGAGSGISSSLGEVDRQMAEAERHTRELEAKADAVDELVAEGVIARPGESAEDLEARRFDALLENDVEGPGDGPHPISS